MDERIARDCECGSYLITNDPYLLDAWNEWHEEGSFVAGRWHRSMTAASDRSERLKGHQGGTPGGVYSGERIEGTPSS